MSYKHIVAEFIYNKENRLDILKNHKKEFIDTVVDRTNDIDFRELTLINSFLTKDDKYLAYLKSHELLRNKPSFRDPEENSVRLLNTLLLSQVQHRTPYNLSDTFTAILESSQKELTETLRKNSFKPNYIGYYISASLTNKKNRFFKSYRNGSFYLSKDIPSLSFQFIEKIPHVLTNDEEIGKKHALTIGSDYKTGNNYEKNVISYYFNHIQETDNHPVEKDEVRKRLDEYGGIIHGYFNE